MGVPVSGKSLLACLVLLLCLGLVLAVPALGADYNVPPNVGGDLDGTASADTFTIGAGGTVDGSVNGLAGDDVVDNAGDVGTGAAGGDINGGAGNDTITNSGTVNGGTILFGDINGGGGSNTITNSGTVESTIIGGESLVVGGSSGSNSITNTDTGDVDYLIGSNNDADSTSGGSNTISNSGAVDSDINGSYNNGDYSSGGSNTITNTSTGQVDGTVYGSSNLGDYSSGGSNVITNYDVFMDVLGSDNEGVGSSGGSNQITNYGFAMDLYGSYNYGPDSSGGYNVITNTDTVFGYIIGSWNILDRANGGGNIISNSGYAMMIAGTVNDGTASGVGLNGGSNTITNSGTVDGDIYGSYNESGGSSGGGNVITNTSSGLADSIVGSWNIGDYSSGGSNTITNAGTAANLVGSSNDGIGASGGSNTVTNSGTVEFDIYGSDNYGVNSSGGGNTITNSGTVKGDVYGSLNEGPASSGGSNTITNSGSIWGTLYGSANTAEGSSGGGNTITNSGTVSGDLHGSYNLGDGTSGGSNTITNSGTVAGNIYGSFNAGVNSSGGGNTITNSGTVNGCIYGSLNQGAGSSATGNTITNSGTIKGSIYAGAGDDTVIIQGASTVGSVVDGQDGSDTLRFEGAGDRSPDQYRNFETLSFGGSGTTTLQGTWRYPSSHTTIDSGTVVIEGALTTASLLNRGILTVNGTLTSGPLTNYGTIGGNGMIHGDISNYGIISPGNSIGTLSVGSEVTFEPGSTFMAQLSCTCSSDLLSVTGAVTINGGTLSASLPRGLYTGGFSWGVIKAAGGVSGLFDTITGQPDSVVLSLEQVNSGGMLSLAVDRRSYGSFTSGGAADLGRGLDGLVGMADGGMKDLLLAMDWDMDGDGIAGVLTALNPEIYTAFTTASLAAGGLFNQAMARRLEELRQRRALSLDQGRAVSGPVRLAAAQAVPLGGNPAPEDGQGWSVWGRGLGLWANRDAAGGYLGYRQTTGGAAVGADGRVNDWLRLGLAAGVTSSDLGFSRAGYSGDMDGVHTGLYAQADLGRAFMRLTLSYASLSSSASRSIAFEDVSTRANGGFDGNLLGAGLAAGYDWRLGDWLLEPMAGLEGQHLEEEGFSEGGAGYLNMDMAEREHDSVLSRLAVRATRLVKLGGWELLPRLGLGWRHQFQDGRPSLSASFSGYGADSFTVEGAAPPGDLAVFEAGVTASARERLSFFADYRLAQGDGYQSQTLGAGLQINF